jgi:hypothetical protein
MSRFNQNKKRTQRYLLQAKCKKLLAQGIEPLIDNHGRKYMTIDGRHYMLPTILTR